MHAMLQHLILLKTAAVITGKMVLSMYRHVIHTYTFLFIYCDGRSSTAIYLNIVGQILHLLFGGKLAIGKVH